MNAHRRHLLSALPAAVAGLAFPPLVRAQPRVDTVRILCGYPPGGALDIISRRIADRLTGSYARVCVVENRPGAAGRIAVAELRKAAPDGSVLLVSPSSVMTMYPHVYRDLAYDPFTDLTPVSIVATTSFALAAGPAVPTSVVGVTDFVQWATANPGLANCGNAGAGSMPHFMALLFAQEPGLALTHVPFKGGTVAMQAAAAGQVAVAFATESAARPMAQAGRLRVLATTATQRSPLHPGAATFVEAGFPRLAQQEWFGAFVPARTQATVVARLNDALRETLRDPATRDIWDKLGLSADGATPEETRTAMRTDHAFWGPVIKASGFNPDA